MGNVDNWRAEVNAADYFAGQKKRQQIDQRRPVIRRASDLVGPGIASQAIRLDNFNDILATFDGYFAGLGLAAEAPPGADDEMFVGIVTSDAEFGGVQMFTRLSDGVLYQRSFKRAPYSPDTINWGDWVVVSDGIGLPTGLPPGGSTDQVLTKDSGTDYDVSWQTPDPPGALKTINTQTGTTYTAVLADADYNAFLTLSNASAVTFTVPPNASVAFQTGSVIEGANLGAGDVTITPGSGVTINAADGLVVEQYSAFGLIKLGTNTWLAYGRISA